MEDVSNILRSARSSVVERCPDKTEVVGPIPTARTVSLAAHQDRGARV